MQRTAEAKISRFTRGPSPRAHAPGACAARTPSGRAASAVRRCSAQQLAGAHLRTAGGDGGAGIGCARGGADAPTPLREPRRTPRTGEECTGAVLCRYNCRAYQTVAYDSPNDTASWHAASRDESEAAPPHCVPSSLAAAVQRCLRCAAPAGAMTAGGAEADVEAPPAESSQEQPQEPPAAAERLPTSSCLAPKHRQLARALCGSAVVRF